MSKANASHSITYDVTALQMPIYYNSVRLDTKPICIGAGEECGVDLAGGDHDHNGLMYALTINVPLLKYIRALINKEPVSDDLKAKAKARAKALNMTFPEPKDPRDPKEARLPHPLVRPLVLRARIGETVGIHLRNEIKDRHVGMHLVADGYDVKTSDGAWVGNNPSSLAAYGECREYRWQCHNEGVFVFHDGGNFDGLEESNEDPAGNPEQKDSSNLHGLFGTLAVEPANAIWRDPVTGLRSAGPGEKFVELDGLYMDILFPGDLKAPPSAEPWPLTVEYTNFSTTAHREYVIVFHDEPEFVPPHNDPAPDPCRECEDSGHGGHGGGHGAGAPIMPISYRAEPMVNREHELFRLLCNDPDHFGDRPVLHEEQHHSSWMFGDPATPILKAYVGDPVRIRLVHGGVMETHVFHLHLYEWHAAPQDRKSPRIDAISFSPQTGHTIEPVWGAGNRHQVPGDVIWHCHLYPHFHEGMWGMFRTFETLQNGTVGDPLNSGASNDATSDAPTPTMTKLPMRYMRAGTSGSIRTARPSNSFSRCQDGQSRPCPRPRIQASRFLSPASAVRSPPAPRGRTGIMGLMRNLGVITHPFSPPTCPKILTIARTPRLSSGLRSTRAHYRARCSPITRRVFSSACSGKTRSGRTRRTTNSLITNSPVTRLQSPRSK
jgi:hypothetical protein